MAGRSTNGHYPPKQVAAGITTYAAAALLLVVAVVSVSQGVSALVHDKLIVVTPDYVYRFNTTAWGWIHIVLGVLLAAVAIGLFWSTTWARVGAIILACLSIVTMFLWLPHSPIWSIVVTALDIVVIWAVANWESPWARAQSEEARRVTGGASQPQIGALFPNGSQWLDRFPSWATLNPMFGGQPIRLEDERGRMTGTKSEPNFPASIRAKISTSPRVTGC